MSWFATSEIPLASSYFPSRAPSQATLPSPQVRAIRRSPFGSPISPTSAAFPITGSPDHGDHPINLAGPLGFEPRQSAPKALDLPLVDGPKKIKTSSRRFVQRARAFFSVRGRRDLLCLLKIALALLILQPSAQLSQPKGVPPSGSTRKTKHLHNSTPEFNPNRNLNNAQPRPNSLFRAPKPFHFVRFRRLRAMSAIPAI
jgi:hypothetical protein